MRRSDRPVVPRDLSFTDSPDARSLTLTLAVATLCVGLFLSTGCQKGDSDSLEQAMPEPVGSGADSVTAEAAADSADLVEEKTPGFFAKLFNKGKEGDDDAKDDPVPVELAFVERRDLPSYLGATATLEPDKQAEVLAKVSGEIRRILVEEGDRVAEGTVLAVLDGAAQEVALEEAEARLRAFEREFDRISSLREKDLASDKDLHDAAARKEEATAQRNAVKLSVDYTRIVAPFSGLITERFVDPGQVVSEGTRLFALVDRDPLLARIYLPEKEAMRTRPGQEVIVLPDDDSDLKVRGEVLRIAPVVDSRTGTVKVTCKIESAPGRLRPGSFVRVLVETEVHLDALCIPKRALVPEGAATYVYKTASDSVEKVAIRTGYTDDLLVEILEGLDEGERVVTVGQGALRPGTKIRQVGEETSGADSASLTE